MKSGTLLSKGSSRWSIGSEDLNNYEEDDMEGTEERTFVGDDDDSAENRGGDEKKDETKKIKARAGGFDAVRIAMRKKLKKNGEKESTAEMATEIPALSPRSERSEGAGKKSFGVAGIAGAASSNFLTLKKKLTTTKEEEKASDTNAVDEARAGSDVMSMSALRFKKKKKGDEGEEDQEKGDCKGFYVIADDVAEEGTVAVWEPGGSDHGEDNNGEFHEDDDGVQDEGKRLSRGDDEKDVRTAKETPVSLPVAAVDESGQNDKSSRNLKKVYAGIFVVASIMATSFAVVMVKKGRRPLLDRTAGDMDDNVMLSGGLGVTSEPTLTSEPTGRPTLTSLPTMTSKPTMKGRF